MNIGEILILALALSIDALIVSFSYGLIINIKKIKSSLMLAIAFGFFQGLMPILGWLLTGVIYSYIERYSKWIVFTVFFILGAKVLKEAIENKEEKLCCLGILCVLGLAIATSIDAFGAGVSIRLLNVGIHLPALLIGIVTLILSFLGFWIANCLNKFPSKYVEIIGASLLFYLAIKSVI